MAKIWVELMANACEYHVYHKLDGGRGQHSKVIIIDRMYLKWETTFFKSIFKSIWGVKQIDR